MRAATGGDDAVNDGSADERERTYRREDKQRAPPREREQQILQPPRPFGLAELANVLAHVLRSRRRKRPQVSHELFELALEIDVSGGHRASSPPVVLGARPAAASRRGGWFRVPAPPPGPPGPARTAPAPPPRPEADT